MRHLTVVGGTAVVLAAVASSSPLAPAAGTKDQSATVARIIAAGNSDPFAHDWLEGLCDGVGPRLTGSPEMDAAVVYALESLREAGFDRVWTEPVKVPRWVRGEESAAVVAPFHQALGLLGLGGSVGTPPEGVEAEVLAVTDFAELEARAVEAAGRIVLFDPPWEGYGSAVEYRTRGAVAAASHGAVAALVRSPASASLGTPHTGIMHYQEGVPAIPAAALTVEDAGRLHRLARRGVKLRVRMQMAARTLGEVEQANVVAELEGRERPDEIVLAGCHLDSWDVGTGAQDDGAGCAIVVGAARLLRSLDLRPRRTVRVVLYVAEEQGGIGGRAYRDAHRAEAGQHVVALESDSGCFPPDGFSVRGGAGVVERLKLMARPLAAVGADSVREGWAGVDIDPLVELGVPGIGHRTKGERYFEYHHSPADTFDKVDPAELADNVAAVAGLLWLLGEEPAPLREGSEDPLPTR